MNKTMLSSVSNSQKQPGDCSSTPPTSCSVNDGKNSLLDILKIHKLF